MRRYPILWLSMVAAVLAVTVPVIPWKPGDRARPLPLQVTPAINGAPPSDAIVLFNGRDLSGWQHGDGKPARWVIGNGYFQVVPKTGDLSTRQPFGDCQLHVEWAAPTPTRGEDQEPGNSGVYLMSTYEIQVLDSYRNKTYADGQAAAVYCQYPPLVNASLPPGEWQSYDIVFHGPRFAGDGALLRPASVTMLHNGILVHDNDILTGPTDYMKRPPYRAHPGKLPLLLQDHGAPVRYRNLWIRELKN